MFGLLYLDQSRLSRQKRELEILNVFKSNNINFTNKRYYIEDTDLYKDLEQFKGVQLSKEFAIYEITFSTDLTIKEVAIISGFDHPIDFKLIKIIKKTQWRSTPHKENQANHKLLFGIYFYPEENGIESFLSQVYH